MPDNDVSLRDYIDSRWRAHRTEHDQQTIALDRARDEVNRRLGEMNNLRDQITAERGEFLSRAEYDAKHDALIERISALERSKANVEGRMWAIGALFIVLQVVLRFIPNLGG